MPRTKVLVNRQQLILESAHELFGRYSFEKTTVDDIARHAGISKGAIYLEFANKDQIIVAIVKQFKDSELSFMTNQMVNARPPILVALNGMLLEHVMRVYDHATSQVHSPEVLIHTHKLVKSKIKFAGAIRELLTRMLEKAKEHDEIARKRDCQHLADLLMASIATLLPPYPQNSTIYEQEYWPRNKFEKNASELLEIFVLGLTVQKLGGR
jgi:AcrR family transcriptional regulator